MPSKVTPIERIAGIQRALACQDTPQELKPALKRHARDLQKQLRGRYRRGERRRANKRPPRGRKA